MNVIWSREAYRQRREIVLYVAQRDRDAARKLVRTFLDSARKLGQFPNLGRAGRIEGTRELQVHKHYFIVYEVNQGSVRILSVWHTAQQYPQTI